jgi:hypothetical protein
LYVRFFLSVYGKIAYINPFIECMIKVYLFVVEECELIEQ